MIEYINYKVIICGRIDIWAGELTIDEDALLWLS